MEHTLDRMIKVYTLKKFIEHHRERPRKFGHSPTIAFATAWQNRAVRHASRAESEVAPVAYVCNQTKTSERMTPVPSFVYLPPRHVGPRSTKITTIAPKKITL
jgi:hypothetical protein